MNTANDKTYLGFDLSTQQLKAIVINDKLEILHQTTVHYDSDLPEFRTSGGVNRKKGTDIVTAPPLMWIKALDLIMEKLRLEGVQFETVISISGSCQQHGSVYWRKGALNKLTSLKSDKFLHSQLQDAFSIYDSPIWMDSSTTKYCHELEEAVGGCHNLIDITGSRAYERFTGSQIAKIYRTKRESYDNTERISLISSFIVSLFIGKYGSIDYADGSGMNLLDLRKKEWSQECCDYCAPNLISKLGPLLPTTSIQARISKYFIERYGFNDNCAIISFTGDNCASLIGMCPKEKDIIISLGTSDTIIFNLDKLPIVSSTFGHIYCNPINDINYMGLVCFKNGSFTRERIRNECAEGDWKLFNELINFTPRGNFGNIGFYFDSLEIYPAIKGDYRFNKYNQLVNNFSKEVDARAVIEGQFMRLSLACSRLGDVLQSSSDICVTGGASCNATLLQILSDVFNSPVYVQNTSNSASFGAALIAKYALCKNEQSFDEMTSHLQLWSLVCKPSLDSISVYSPMIERYQKLEEQLMYTINSLP